MSKLTQEEIIQALLEGKKIRHDNWDKKYYVHFINGNLINESGVHIYQINLNYDWEFYIETVTFFEALEAMKEGKWAKQIGKEYILYFDKYGFLSYLANNANFELTKKDLDAKWQILEGEENE